MKETAYKICVEHGLSDEVAMIEQEEQRLNYLLAEEQTISAYGSIMNSIGQEGAIENPLNNKMNKKRSKETKEKDLLETRSKNHYITKEQNKINE